MTPAMPVQFKVSIAYTTPDSHTLSSREMNVISAGPVSATDRALNAFEGEQPDASIASITITNTEVHAGLNPSTAEDVALQGSVREKTKTTTAASSADGD